MASSKYRLPDELKNPELNYYIAFDIEPTETNIKKIEEALNKKRSTFARTVTPITTRLNELKDDIDKIMLEDAVLVNNPDGTKDYAPKSGGRKIESDNAKGFFAERAIEMAKSICRSGFIEDTKISEIAKRFYVSDKEILNGIDSLLNQGVKLIKTAGAKREVAFSNFKKIDSFLKTLGKKNLYDFSELPESSQTKVLYDKQEEIYSLFSKKANDAKGKAAMDLSGIGKVVFKSEAARKEYDTYYKTKSNVWDLLSTFADSGLKTINDKIFIECLDTFRNQAGLMADEAEKELYAYLEYFRLSREHADKIRIEVCPYDDCGKSYVYQEGIKSCPNCGKPLEIKCWNCGEVALFVSKTQPCSKCGITAQNKIEFDKAQQNFSGLFKKIGASDIDLANALNAMENVYPAYDQISGNKTIEQIISSGKIIEITLDFSTRKEESELLLSILTDKIYKLNYGSIGGGVAVVVDEVPNESLLKTGFDKLMMTSDKCHVVYSIMDIASLAEKTNVFIDKADSLFFFQQQSNKNQEFCSEFFGTYEKQRVSQTQTSGTSYGQSSSWGWNSDSNYGGNSSRNGNYGKNSSRSSSTSQTYTTEKERIYLPDVFKDLPENQCIYFFRSNRTHNYLNLG